MQFGDDLKKVPITCSSQFGQACYAYRSIISANPEFEELTCNDDLGTTSIRRKDYPATARWLREHGGNSVKSQWLQGAQEQNCERDEYPPSYFMQDKWIDSQRMRLLPGPQNQAAGQLWKGFCYTQGIQDVKSNDPPITKPIKSIVDSTVKRGSKSYILKATSLPHAGRTIDLEFANNLAWLETTYTTKMEVSVPVKPVFTFAQFDVSDSDDGLTDNPCWPKKYTPNDPGYVLLTEDEFYKGQPPPIDYTKPPPGSGGSGSKARRALGDTLDDMGGLVNRTFEA